MSFPLSMASSKWCITGLYLLLGWFHHNPMQAKGTAYSSENKAKLIVALPAYNDSVLSSESGSKIFINYDYRFYELPRTLDGSSYLFSTSESSKSIIPITTGFLYVITPSSGEIDSQQEKLLSSGFELVNSHVENLYSQQTIRLSLLKKEITYERFRLKNIELEGWVIAFFQTATLPSFVIPATLQTKPGTEYAKETRLWQGCPSIEITGKKMWAAWFSGGSREPDHGNYGIISTSTDNGKSWDDPTMVITHPDENVRVMDTQLWKDPLGRLWIMWVQNTGSKGFDGIWGTWGMYTENPENPNPEWSHPQRLCDGLTRNKPLVLSSGEWLLPSYDWIHYQSTIYMSDDHGATWRKQGGPVNEKIQNFYEHMCVELSDGRIWMLQRNIQQSFSKDKGKNWTDLEPLPNFNSANSRLYIGRLQSGNLILVFNDDEAKQRRNMTAYLSTDEGQSWPHKLVIDERDEVSYPELVQNDDGLIYLVYDRSRTGEKEILMAVFNENDVVAGKFQSGNALQKHLISKGLGKL